MPIKQSTVFLLSLRWHATGLCLKCCPVNAPIKSVEENRTTASCLFGKDNKSIRGEVACRPALMVHTKEQIQ